VFFFFKIGKFLFISKGITNELLRETHKRQKHMRFSFQSVGNVFMTRYTLAQEICLHQRARDRQVLGTTS